MSQARAPSWWPAAAVQCLEDLASYRLAGASQCIGRIGEALVAVAEAAHGPSDTVFGRVAEAGRRQRAAEAPVSMQADLINGSSPR